MVQAELKEPFLRALRFQNNLSRNANGKMVITTKYIGLIMREHILADFLTSLPGIINHGQMLRYVTKCHSDLGM